MLRVRAIKSSPFNHYNFIAPRYITRRYMGWLGLRAASHYKRLAATNFAKLWRSRRRVTPPIVETGIISSVRNIQRRQQRSPSRPFCRNPLIASARWREAIGIKSSKLTTPRASMSRAARRTTKDAATKFANFEIDIVGYEVPFTDRNLFPPWIYACGAARRVSQKDRS